jgi:uncharacterized repeat protein (TIGR01451 family)
MKKTSVLLLFLFIAALRLYATGEPSTYFNIFVPPNNDAVQRNVCLIVTAIYDSTHFQIVDDGADGDTDDSKSGVLNAGQSYILYIKDNGINDDAQYASGGTLKRDGDYFIITSDKIVYASQSTDSDWQHDWVPAVSKSGIGNKFIIYAPKRSSSDRDLNVFAYSDSTRVTIRKISLSTTTTTGYTTVAYEGGTLLTNIQLNRGQDLIYYNTAGRNIMVPGETYVVESNKPVSVQYGALYTNERDGGGYVPSSNGSCRGDLFYFAVPYQAALEQEIRIISASSNNVVTLERYSAGTWIQMRTWTLNQNGVADWVGRTNSQTWPTVFRVKCTPGKNVLVFEANWLETGNPGTSDIATMASSTNGTSSGTNFIVYMSPPGNEQNVTNPFTGTLFGQRLTHAYIFAEDSAVVTVKDLYTGGTDFSRSYTIPAGRYVDCYLTETEWKAIYNGTGTTAAGPERPYLQVLSNNPVAVMITNFNDNWMMYFGSSRIQGIEIQNGTGSTTAKPGDTVAVTGEIIFNDAALVTGVTASIIVKGSAEVIDAHIIRTGTVNDTLTGAVTTTSQQTIITFNQMPDLDPTDQYTFQANLSIQPFTPDGTVQPNNSLTTIDFTATGIQDGKLQQAVSTQAIQTETSATSQLIFSASTSTGVTSDATDSWAASWIDFDNDGDEDVYVCDKRSTSGAFMYRNNGNATFTKITSGAAVTTNAPDVAACWADTDNDNDADMLAAVSGRRENLFFTNNSGILTLQPQVGLNDTIGYYHAVSMVDYDNDGFADVFLGNYMSTRFGELYHNNQNGTFTKVLNTPMSTDTGRVTGATWADYDNDGDQDLFEPVGNNQNNRLYRNEGGGQFTRITTGPMVQSAGNSTGSAWGDIDNDGDLDLFVSNASAQNNFLYINNGNGTFTTAPISTVNSAGGHSHGCGFQDVDNDKDLDLYVNNDQGRSFLYINEGTGNFSPKNDELVTGKLIGGIGQCWSDFDRDGDMDVLVLTHSNRTNLLFTNNGNSNNWLSVKLIGTASNASAIGARITVVSGGTRQIREINSQSGFGGQNSYRAHFGMGADAAADSIIIKWPSGLQQVITGQPANEFLTVTEPSTALITGRVIYDRNASCTTDAGDEAAANQRVIISPGNLICFTNSQGDYTARLEPGTYTITGNAVQPWQNACSAVQVTATQAQQQVQAGDLYVRAINQVNDISVTGAQSMLRRGFNNILICNISNRGTETANNVVLTITMPTGISIVSAERPYTQLNATTWQFQFSSIAAGASESFQLTDYVGLSLSVGTPVELTLNTTAAGTDDFPVNNTYLIQQPITGPIDPNDIAVTPAGDGNEGYINGNETLHYRIRFQNVGTAPAHQVIVTDMLPPLLTINSFSMIASSHPYELSITPEGLCTWTFSGINLPDSATNQEGSNGVIEFEIGIQPGLPSGSVISNSAKIVFDFEDAIQTNTVMNTIKFIRNGEGESLTAYPNPATNFITISAPGASVMYADQLLFTKCTVYGADGRVVYENTFNPTAQHNLQTAMWPGGVYVAELQTAEGERRYIRIVHQSEKE